MSEWAKSAVEQAVASLSAEGKIELAADLRRIAQVVQLADIEALRFPQSERIAEKIGNAVSYEALNDVLHEMCRAFRLQNATFHVVSEGSENIYGSKVITTYPIDWITEYVEGNYASIDPVIEACQDRTESFSWADLETNDAMSEAFMQKAYAAGIGPSGHTFLVATETGDRFGLSVVSSFDEDAFSLEIEKFEFDLSMLTRRFCAAFVRIATGGRQAIGPLPPDVLRLLRAVATGATPDELTTMEFSYGSAQTLEKSICAIFRTRTLTEAVVLAARVGWLESTPLAKNEIIGLSASRKPLPA